jgi:hypothetical protein
VESQTAARKIEREDAQSVRNPKFVTRGGVGNRATENPSPPWTATRLALERLVADWRYPKNGCHITCIAFPVDTHLYPKTSYILDMIRNDIVLRFSFFVWLYPTCMISCGTCRDFKHRKFPLKKRNIALRLVYQDGRTRSGIWSLAPIFFSRFWSGSWDQ